MNKKIFLLLSILIWAVEMSGQWSLKTNLPTIYINTFDGKGITSKTTYVNAKMVYMDEDSHIIFVKSEYRMVRIDIRQIRYVEAMSEYLRLYLEGETKPIIALLSMKRLEERLPQNFMRVHRSYIVNLQKIQQIERGRIVMDKDTYIPVSEGYKEAFNRFLSEKALEK